MTAGGPLREDEPCNLLAEDMQCLGDDALREWLQMCVVAEHALMAQYFYMLATLPKVPDAATFEEQALIRRAALTLHQLSIAEMGHMATACNLLVLLGGSPHFRADALRTPSVFADSAGDAFALAPCTTSELERLRRYESWKDVGIHFPVATGLDVAGLSLGQPPKVGYIYRRVYFTLCMRHRADPTAQFATGTTPWSPILGRGSDMKVAIWPLPRGTAYFLEDAVRAIVTVLREGEGGGDDKSHVELIDSLIADAPALERLTVRTISRDPARASLLRDSLARHLADLTARSYEVVLCALYLLWLDAIPLSVRQRHLTRLGGFMTSVFGNIASLLAVTPVADDGLTVAGPTFEVIDDVDRPASLGQAQQELQRRARALTMLLRSPVPHPPAKAPHSHDEYRARLGALCGPVETFIAASTR